MENDDKPIEYGKGILQQIEEHKEYTPITQELIPMWKDVVKELSKARLPKKMLMTIGEVFINSLSDEQFIDFLKCDWIEVIMGANAMRLFNKRMKELDHLINPAPRSFGKKKPQVKLYNQNQPWKKAWKR